MITQVVEDYLKAICDMESSQEKVTTSALAATMEVSQASVSDMLKKLRGMGLIDHAPYRRVKLTSQGEKIALEVVRHHRLIESYLMEAMGLSWDKVHDEAEKWEHVLSEELEDKMAEMLGHPTTDPHGAPIPSKDGTVVSEEYPRLSELEEGEGAVIRHVSDREPEKLRYFADRGMYPEAEVEVTAVEPFNGPVTVRVGEVDHVIGHEIASEIFVSRRPAKGRKPVAKSQEGVKGTKKGAKNA